MRTIIWLIGIGIAALILLGIGFLVFGVYVVAARLGMPTVDPSPAGFWLGLWQGLIVILSFITGLFDHNISIYQVGNNGAWYHFGYLLGVSIAMGGTGAASKKR
ncbi:hypothetical protein KC571_01585 [candidate division WWE3 bacterium]|uniref:Uncharacterized protein n=1 Tax=candidate division WWE3 bacterium TaxID=2053526 RepID=A0A955RPB9_UNCKA|nr:hypothetical protein [candidate division WWE3 bacterium]